MNDTTTPTALHTGDHLTFTVGGRELHIWVHDCPQCTSIDLWTTRGNEVEDISADTGDKSRAPTGVMLWRNGSRPDVIGDPEPGSHKWPAYGTITAIWHDGVPAG